MPERAWARFDISLHIRGTDNVPADLHRADLHQIEQRVVCRSKRRANIGPDLLCLRFDSFWRAAIRANPGSWENDKEHATAGATLERITMQPDLAGDANVVNTHVNFPYTLTPAACYLVLCKRRM